MDREVLKEMKQTLAEKTLEKLTLSNDNNVILPKEFCRQVVFGTRPNTCLPEMRLILHPESWDCSYDGWLVCLHACHILCDSVRCIHSIYYVTSNSEGINVYYVSLCVHAVHMYILFTCSCSTLLLFPYLAPADIHGRIQRASLHKVPVDVLPRLLRWFSQAKHLAIACHDIHPPQEVQCVHMYR